MDHVAKYRGIIPAFYACYDAEGRVDRGRVAALATHLTEKGVRGLYVGGSSGECIYQSVHDRKATLEAVMAAVGGKLTVIAHVACNNTADSVELAAHAEALGVDAIAAIPPIYFPLSEAAIAAYWNAISAAAPKTAMILYNIPQLAGTALTPALYEVMLDNPRVIGVKNSSMSGYDIERFVRIGGPDRIVLNGPDEQLAAGLALGAGGGIGGTYAVMPELYLAIFDAVQSGDLTRAAAIGHRCNAVIETLCAGQGHMYALIKAVLQRREGLELGGVRPPLPALTPADDPLVDRAIEQIDAALAGL